MTNNKPKYNKKFKLLNKDGTINEGGPGYDIIDNNNIIITNTNLYNENVHIFIRKINVKDKMKAILRSLKKYITEKIS